MNLPKFDEPPAHLLGALLVISMALVGALWGTVIWRMSASDTAIGELRGQVETMSVLTARNSEAILHLSTEIGDLKGDIKELYGRLEKFKSEVNDRMALQKR